MGDERPLDGDDAVECAATSLVSTCIPPRAPASSPSSTSFMAAARRCCCCRGTLAVRRAAIGPLGTAKAPGATSSARGGSSRGRALSTSSAALSARTRSGCSASTGSGERAERFDDGRADAEGRGDGPAGCGDRWRSGDLPCSATRRSGARGSFSPVSGPLPAPPSLSPPPSRASLTTSPALNCADAGREEDGGGAGGRGEKGDSVSGGVDGAEVEGEAADSEDADAAESGRASGRTGVGRIAQGGGGRRRRRRRCCGLWSRAVRSVTPCAPARHRRLPP